jgi:hypothetical protein
MVFCREILKQVQDDTKKLPPMREKMMPDILPSLFGLEVEIHSFWVKKIPQEFFTHGGFWRNIVEKYLGKNTTPWGEGMMPRCNNSGVHILKYRFFWRLSNIIITCLDYLII